MLLSRHGDGCGPTDAAIPSSDQHHLSSKRPLPLKRGGIPARTHQVLSSRLMFFVCGVGLMPLLSREMNSNCSAQHLRSCTSSQSILRDSISTFHSGQNREMLPDK